MTWTSAHSSIVCAVSGSDRDRALLRVGGVLAARAGLAVEAFHAHEPRDTAVAAALADPIAQAPVFMALDGVEDDAHVRAGIESCAEWAGCDLARCEVATGPPEALLRRISGRPDVACLVVGDRGGSVLRAAVAVSITRRLLSFAGCPVAVVCPGAATAADQARQVVGVIADDDDAPPVAAAADALGRRIGAPVRLVHAGGPAGDALVRALDEAPDGIVVTASPAHGLLRSALCGSVTHALLAREDRRLVVVVPRERETTREAPPVTVAADADARGLP